MNGTVARVLLAGALALAGKNHVLVAEQDWTYPPAISLDELRERLAQVPPDHPRLLVRDGELERLRQFASEDPVRHALADAIVRQANQLRNERPISRAMEGRRLLRQSRICVQRVLTLATAYHLTGDERYASRGQREMLAAARFPDWNPAHFLDVAEMTTALAIGYDWLYDQLEPDARAEIRQAIVEKGVSLTFDSPYAGCVKAGDNWGQVCNGGLTLGALAVLEDEPDLAARIVDNTLRSATVAMHAYAPRGGYPEGPDYWSYGTSYTVLTIAALESVFGTDFGLSQAPGFDITGQFLALLTGPTGLEFNYADSRGNRNPQPAQFWLASRYGRPDWLVGERERLLEAVATLSREEERAAAARFLPLGLLWWQSPDKALPTEMPLHWSSDGAAPITVHRSSWTDPNATFVGLKAGTPLESHGQLDIGSFVLDADGVRWAVDLGNEAYGAIEARGLGLWRFEQDSDRWRIFRLSNLGHNALVIDGQLQRAEGRATVVAFSDDPAFPHSIIDMSALYAGQAQSVRRGVALLPSGEVLIQDELTGLAPGSRVRWGMITTGKPESGQTSAIVLRQGEERLRLTGLTSDGLRWETIDTSRRANDWDSPNPGTRMITLTVDAPSSGELTIAVLAEPGADLKTPPRTEPLRPLSDWSPK